MGNLNALLLASMPTWLDSEDVQCAIDSFDAFFLLAGRDCSTEQMVRLGSVSTRSPNAGFAWRVRLEKIVSGEWTQQAVFAALMHLHPSIALPHGSAVGSSGAASANPVLQHLDAQGHRQEMQKSLRRWNRVEAEAIAPYYPCFLCEAALTTEAERKRHVTLVHGGPQEFRDRFLLLEARQRSSRT